MHISLGYVSGGSVTQPFFEAMTTFLAVDGQGRKVATRLHHGPGLYVFENRNHVVKSFLETDNEALLFLDSDIKFTPEQVYLLVDRMDKDHRIISGMYFNWQNGPGEFLVPMWYKYANLKPGDVGLYKNVPSFDTNTMQEIDGCGMGFCLIGRDVFEKIGFPWFYHTDITQPGAMPAHVKIPDTYTTPQFVGEDFDFCIKAHKAGIKIWGFGTVVTHIKSHGENLETAAKNGSGIHQPN